MRLAGYAIVLAAAFVIPGCATSRVLHQQVSYYPFKSDATIEMAIPPGWEEFTDTTRMALSPDGKGKTSAKPTAINLQPAGWPKGDEPPTIQVSFSKAFEANPPGRQGQENQANADLAAIHRQSDPDVTMRMVASFDTTRYGILNLYGYSSPYWKERRMIFIQQEKDCVTIELFCHDERGANRYTAALIELARSIRINVGKFSSAVNGT